MSVNGRQHPLGTATWTIVARAAIGFVCVAAVIMGQPRPQAQTGPDPVKRVPNPLRGRYVVKLHSSADADAVALESAAALRGRVRHVYSHAVKGFSLDLSDAAARTLARDPRVAMVEEDGLVAPAAVQLSPPSWGLDRIDQRTLPLDDRYTYTMPAVAANVYIIDSGIRISHVEFEGRAFIAGDFVDDDGDGDPQDIGNDDGVPSMPDGLDCLGHGTLMAGTIGGGTVGVARNAILWSLRIFGCDGIGTWSGVIAALDMAAAEASRPAVVNLSLAGSPSAVADDAVRQAVASGIIVVAAAGNAGGDAGSYSPSRLNQALVVGSTAADDQRSQFSNHGASVDLFAPGEAITSAALDDDLALGIVTGTSVAAAHGAGVAALILGSSPGASPAAVEATIILAATTSVVGDPVGAPNRLLYSGAVASTGSLTITTPNTRVNWGRGSRQTIAWTHDLSAGSRFRVRLSRDGGRSFTTIADAVRNGTDRAARVDWLVEGPNTSAAIIGVESLDGTATDLSDTSFVIADPFIRLRSPNGGDTWRVGQTPVIRWDDNLGAADRVTIALSKNGGATYKWILAPSAPADGAHTVTVRPDHAGGRLRLGVFWSGDPRVAGVSEGTFRVRP